MQEGHATAMLPLPVLTIATASSAQQPRLHPRQLRHSRQWNTQGLKQRQDVKTFVVTFARCVGRCLCSCCCNI